MRWWRLNPRARRAISAWCSSERRSPAATAIGHDGETMAFFSDLEFFPADGIGIFVSRDGIGEIKTGREIPNITP